MPMYIVRYYKFPDALVPANELKTPWFCLCADHEIHLHLNIYNDDRMYVYTVIDIKSISMISHEKTYWTIILSVNIQTMIISLPMLVVMSEVPLLSE